MGDSQEKPLQAASASNSKVRAKALPLPSKERKPVAPWTLASEPKAPQKDRLRRKREADLEQERLNAKMQELGSRLRPSSARPACERLAELKARVLHT